MATILYDNDSPHMSFFPSGLLVQSDECLGGSLTGADKLNITFQGTSITLFGVSYAEVLVILDGERQPDVPAKNGTLSIFYRSPTLPDATHNLTMMTLKIGAANILFIDYATVNAGENTPLQGQRLIVDESDPSVVFEGDWVKCINPVFDEVGRRDAYANTTHQTSVTAAVTFKFNGTTVSVFGPSSDAFPLFLEIELDGGTESPPSSLTNSSNFAWFQKDGLSPTNHTLLIKHFSGENIASFNLDYIIYTPSFASLAENGGLSSISSSSQPAATNTTSSLPNHHGISRTTLLGAVIGPVLGVIIILLLLVLYKKKLLCWSYRRRPNIVDPFQLPDRQTRALRRLRVYHKPSLTHGPVVESPIRDEDLPLVEIPAANRAPWWARLWRRPDNGRVEAFPSNWDPEISRQPMVRHKPTLPTWHVAQQRASRLSDFGSANETIAADPRLQELEDMVLALQEEIEQTRQDRFGAQNGALMRELVANRSGTSNEDGQQEHGDHGSVAVSTTVV